MRTLPLILWLLIAWLLLVCLLAPCEGAPAPAHRAARYDPRKLPPIVGCRAGLWNSPRGEAEAERSRCTYTFTPTGRYVQKYHTGATYVGTWTYDPASCVLTVREWPESSGHSPSYVNTWRVKLVPGWEDSIVGEPVEGDFARNVWLRPQAEQ